ncbi:MAG: hypothetical protein WAK16_00905 [Candidatus Cybelea sp.]
MLGRTFRGAFAAVAALTISNIAMPARADGTADVYQQSILPGANTAIKNYLNSQKLKATQPPALTTGPNVAQVPPVQQKRLGPVIALPQGLSWTADVSSAYPYGNIGSYGKTWLMGGVDLSAAYGFNWSTRVQVSMFQLQHWPQGFNSGLAPVYLAGFQNPVGCADLSNGTACGPGTGRNINVATKDTFGVFMVEKLFTIKSSKLPGPVPIVISPTYVARGGIIAFAPGHNDVVPFTYNLPDGPVENIPVRTAQYYAVAITLPFLKTPKMFGTLTVAPQWLVHTAGANSGNSMQFPQVLYLEYTPTKMTTLFFEPQSARDYLPTDPYPEHLFAYFLGVQQRLTRYAFAAVVLNSGSPTNLGPDGVVGIKCLTVQQAINNACGLAIGGLKATQLQFQLGLGSPTYFPL